MKKTQLAEMRIVYEKMGVDAFALTHYELATHCDNKFVASEWKEFLTTPEIVDWIRAERTLLMEAELQKAVTDIGKSKSVGKAQSIAAIQKLLEQRKTKEGAVFIYTYVPLDADQAQAPNVREEARDIFMAEPTTSTKFFKEDK